MAIKYAGGFKEERRAKSEYDYKREKRACSPKKRRICAMIVVGLLRTLAETGLSELLKTAPGRPTCFHPETRFTSKRNRVFFKSIIS